MGSPPIQPATKSSSWKLPMVGASAPRPPGAGSVPIQRVRGMARSRGAPEDSPRLPSSRRSVAKPSVQSPAARASPQPGQPAADSTPPADLKGEAGRRGEGALRGSTARARGRDHLSPLVSLSASPLANCRTSAPRGKKKGPLVPAAVHVAADTGSDFRDICAKLIARGRAGCFIQGQEVDYLPVKTHPLFS